jgi:hypothetical protein
VARHFPHWLKAYIEYTRETEAPMDFHFWTGVWTIAGALRRRVWQDQRYFQWTPNFYIFLVAPAGIATKSTTLTLGQDLLAQVDGVHIGPDSGSWQGLGDALAESLEYFDYTNGTGVTHQIPMSAVTIAASELGTFLKPDDEQAVSFLTDMWDGKLKTYKHRTKHSGSIEIKNAWMNIMGATTPSWIQRNIPESMIGEGLLSRVIFVYADKKRELISLPSRRIKGPEFHALRDKLIDDLKHISTLVGEYQFTDEVQRDGGWMDQWYTRHHGPRPTSVASERYGGYLSRKQTHMVKLALVLAAAKRDALIITREDLEEADLLLRDAEVSMIKVFEAIGGVDEAKQVAELAAFVRAYKFLTIKELYRCCFNIMSEDTFKAALKLAIEGNLFEFTIHDGKQGIQLAPKRTN